VVYVDDSYLMREAVGQLLDGARGINLVAVCASGAELWKAIAERARVAASRTRKSAPLAMSDRDALLTRAVTWCIERYYQNNKPPE